MRWWRVHMCCCRSSLWRRRTPCGRQLSPMAIRCRDVGPGAALRARHDDRHRSNDSPCLVHLQGLERCPARHPKTVDRCDARVRRCTVVHRVCKLNWPPADRSKCSRCKHPMRRRSASPLFRAISGVLFGFAIPSAGICGFRSSMVCLPRPAAVVCSSIGTRAGIFRELRKPMALWGGAHIDSHRRC